MDVRRGEWQKRRIMPVPSLVLLVEDNPMIAMNTEILLLDLGVGEVRTAATVMDALALVDDARFDLAILDVRLAEGEDSLPVAARLSDLAVPLVFATGLSDDLILPAQYKATPMLRKPYGFEELGRVVRRG